MPPPCFNDLADSTGTLTLLYAALTQWYPGWPLSEIRDLTIRERDNWLEIARWRERRRRRSN